MTIFLFYKIATVSAEDKLNEHWTFIYLQVLYNTQTFLHINLAFCYATI